MSYSNKQYLFAKYLLNIFGIDDSKFIEEFLRYYSELYGVFAIRQSGSTTKMNTTYYDSSESINQLLIEKQIRSERYKIIRKIYAKEKLSATDLSNFIFCPISFIINYSFQIDFPTGEKQRLFGEKLHEELHLLKRFEDSKKITEDNNEYRQETVYDDLKIKKITNSKLIYSGHNRDQKKIFANNNAKIICDPDYIFLDEDNQYFLVEEKYHYQRDPNKQSYSDIEKEINNSFYKNHQIQVIAYLKNIFEYKLDYAYLVYWYYDFPYNFNFESNYSFRQINIHTVKVKKISLNSINEEFYEETVNSINNLLTTKKIVFDTNTINPNKCGGCVVNKYCGHKNKKLTECSFPYNVDYLKFYPVDFPMKLKKSPPPAGAVL